MSTSPLLVCMFHLNLAFSSLATEGHAAVIERCYWPMLRLAERTPFPIAFEATGWTLERIAERDPRWIEHARELLEAGRAELVGSAYAQCAAPLLPAEVNRWNLRLGLEAYERLVGVTPRLALVCEQAYSPGLVGVYAEAGYEGLIADWDNAYRSHREWDASVRRNPQRALSAGGTSIPVIWSDSIAFQKFQRLAHDEMDLEPYVEFVGGVVEGDAGSLLLYANDAEVFDHRPGRFAAEPALREGEWDRVASALVALADREIGQPALPSEILGLLDGPGAGRDLHLEAPDQPVPVKKQDKYNISRWAVTGRDDIGINTRCWRIYAALLRKGIDDPDAWRELCALWASDFRTHITDGRWTEMLSALEAAESRLGVTAGSPRAIPDQAGETSEVARRGRHWRVRTGHLDVVLNARRGLAIESFVDRRLGDESLFGTIEHGYFPTIDLGADWYTGNLVQEAPLRSKVTDLEAVEPAFARLEDGQIRVWGEVETALGPVEKILTIDGESGTVEIDVTLRWSELPSGALRVGHLVLAPAAFDLKTLFYACHNGGEAPDIHHLVPPRVFDHGSAVSALVSARQGLGVTEGELLLGDAERAVRMSIDQSVCKPMALVGLTPMESSFFFRAALSLTESDDTRRGGIPRDASSPQRFRFTISAGESASAVLG